MHWHYLAVQNTNFVTAAQMAGQSVASGRQTPNMRVVPSCLCPLLLHTRVELALQYTVGNMDMSGANSGSTECTLPWFHCL